MADPITGLSVAQLATQLRILGLDQIQNNDIAVDHVMAIDTPTQTYKLTVQQLSDFIEGIITTLPNLTGYVDLTTAQDVGGSKRITAGLKIANNAASLRIQGVNTNATSGDLIIKTLNDDLTTIVKTNAAGNADIGVMEIDTLGSLGITTDWYSTGNAQFDNNQSVVWLSVAGNVALGAKRIINGADNVFRFMHHTGSAWTDVISIREDGAFYLSKDMVAAANINVRNNKHILFNNDADDFGLGTKRILNDASNVLRIQHHNGTDWQNAIMVVADGRTQFYDINGDAAALVEEVGTAVLSTNAIITLEKGDFRFAKLAGLNTQVFNVAPATAADHAVNKGQADSTFLPKANVSSPDGGQKVFNFHIDTAVPPAAYGLPVGWAVDPASTAGNVTITHPEGHKVFPVVTSNETGNVARFAQVAHNSTTEFTLQVRDQDSGNIQPLGMNVMVIF